MKKIVWILIIVAVLAAGAVALLRKKGEPPIEVTIDKATRGDITSVVTATGKIFSEVEVRISSEVAGEIIELPVKDGSKVKRGDLLVRVNPDRLQAQVHQEEAALRATQANAAEARARMEQNKLDLERLRSAIDQPVPTERDVADVFSGRQHRDGRPQLRRSSGADDGGSRRYVASVPSSGPRLGDTQLAAVTFSGRGRRYT